MPVCVINQPAGLGDILFSQKIGRHYLDSGYTVNWVIDSFYFDCVHEHLGGSGINYINKSSHDYPFKVLVDQDHMLPVCWGNGGSMYIPLVYSDRTFTPGSWMNSKYESTGVDMQDWKDYVHIKRNPERESNLISQLNLPEEFALVNNTYGPPGNVKIHNIRLTRDLPVVNVQFIDGYTPFDWIGVIEKSKEFHTVDTSFSLIVESELEKYESTDLFMYPRRGAVDRVINDLFSWERWKVG